jgi:hypothetical protein
MSSPVVRLARNRAEKDLFCAHFYNMKYRIKHLGLITCLMLPAIFAAAQTTQSLYKLIYFKGTLEYSQKKNTWGPLAKPGSVLAPNGSVKLGPQSDAFFANDKNEMVRIKQEGTYPVSDFAKYMLPADEQSLATHYIRFVAKQIVNQDKVLQEKNKELSGSGGNLSASCLLLPLDGEAVQLEKLKFAWKNFSSRPYTFKIFADPEGERKVYEVLTRDTLIAFKEDEEPVNAGGSYWWTVESKGSAACEMHAMRVNSDALQMQDSVDFETLRKQLDFSAGMNYFIEAEFWRERGSWPTAGYYYKQAETAEPANDFFRMVYSDFKRYLMVPGK